MSKHIDNSTIHTGAEDRQMRNVEPGNSKLLFSGVLGFDCGTVERYSGSDKQLQEKGFVVHNGIPTLRGFAKISDLAKASKAKYESYQREKNQAHVTTRTIERVLGRLKASGHINRKGGTRGIWEVVG